MTAIRADMRGRVRSTPGAGLCGCEDPRRHQRGCLWHLDRAKVRKAASRRGLDLLTPRPGCCAICGERLDALALEVHDQRCTSCYRALFAANAAHVLGGTS